VKRSKRYVLTHAHSVVKIVMLINHIVFFIVIVLYVQATAWSTSIVLAWNHCTIVDS
jgi:hypothetical protein